MASSPSTNGSNGRDSNGRFAVGNRGGPGNPHAQQVAQYRSLLLQAVSEDDFLGVVNSLVNQAKEGDLAAARILLDRLLGRPCSELDHENIKLKNKQASIAEQRLELDEDKLWSKP